MKRIERKINKNTAFNWVELQEFAIKQVDESLTMQRKKPFIKDGAY